MCEAYVLPGAVPLQSATRHGTSKRLQSCPADSMAKCSNASSHVPHVLPHMLSANLLPNTQLFPSAQILPSTGICGWKCTCSFAILQQGAALYILNHK